MKQNPIGSEHLAKFVRSYNPTDRDRREETAVFRRFTYSKIVARGKANLDIRWQSEVHGAGEDEQPEELVKEILSDLAEAMREFATAEAEIE